MRGSLFTMIQENDEIKQEAENEEGGEPQVYELGYHLIPTLSPDEVLKGVEALTFTISKHGGSPFAEENPKHMNLAYPFTKRQEDKNTSFTSSFFGWVKFDIIPEKVPALSHDILARKDMLRFIIIKTVRDYTPIEHKQLFREVVEESKPISKPKVAPPKKSAEPISDAELDKTIEELVAE